MDLKKAVKESRKIDNEFNYFNYLDERPKANEKQGKLSNYIISVKDCICVKGMESTAGSRILIGYKPLFNATVIQRCTEQGATIIGKTSQDEFGFGGFNTNTGIGFKIPKNPYDKHRACGGSSGGAAGFTQRISQTEIKHIALAESTGGSIVAPACFCGVFGLCPTYSLVSRYGLMDYANSLDKIGPIASNMYDIALMLEIIAGHDEKDSTSYETAGKINTNYTDFLKKSVKGMKIGIVKETMKDIDKDVEQGIKDAIKTLEKQGVKFEEVSLPYTQKYGLAAYYLIAMAEASTNLAKYSGLRYGKHDPLNKNTNFNDYFSEVRSKCFGKEAKRRIILGTFARMAGYRDAYYIKALKIRTEIIEEYKKLFKTYDALLSPTMPILPPSFKEIDKLTPLQNYMMDIMTTGPNLTGLPHINVPIGFVEVKNEKTDEKAKKSENKKNEKAKKLPLGALLIADHFKEENLIKLGCVFDK